MKKLLTALLGLLMLLPSVGWSEGGMAVGTSAKACVIIDEATGRILLAHNADEPLPMASTTKVMTALLALERGDLTAPVTCSRNAFGVPGTSIYLSEGETLTLEHMLYGLMLASGNDAATAIAEHIGGTVAEFCRMMTSRAAELGCTNTIFLTPHGLPQEGHYTTAYDLALIAREAMKHDTFRRIVSTQRAKIPWEGREYDRVLNNKNKLLSTYEGATGIKTGYTRKAGRCLVFGAERNGMRIIGVVLNCYDWFDEAARLMDQAFTQYEAIAMMTAGECIRQIPVTASTTTAIGAVLQENLTGVAVKNALPRVEIDLPDSVEAPVSSGDVLGEIRLLAGNELIGRSALVANSDALLDDFASRWQMYWSNWLSTD